MEYAPLPALFSSGFAEFASSGTRRSGFMRPTSPPACGRIQPARLSCCPTTRVGFAAGQFETRALERTSWSAEHMLTGEQLIQMGLSPCR